MRIKLIWLGCFLLLFTLTNPAFAAELIVGGPESSYPSIQTAVDAAADGDTLLLNPGIYDSTGDLNVDISSKSLTIRSRYDNPESCVIDCRHQGRAFIVSGGQTLTLKGIMIRNGWSGSDNRGGAIYCFEATLAVDSCIFRDNRADIAGGSVACYAYFENSTFQATFNLCAFYSNDATAGGAVSAEVEEHDSAGPISQLAFTNCVFSENSSTERGGAVAQDYKVATSYRDCGFTENHTANAGGAVCVSHYSASSLTTHSLAITYFVDSSFENNRATVAPADWSSAIGGGALCISQNVLQARLERCRLTGNRAPLAGAIFSYTSSLMVQNTLVSGNVSTLTAAIPNAAILCQAASFINCTLARNQGFWYGAIYAVKLALHNCILWGNSPSGLASDDDYAVTCCDIQGGYADGSDNIDADPQFVSVAGDDFHLCPESPCIDSGCDEDAPKDDLDGNGRPTGEGIDIGAYEFQELLLWQGKNTDWEDSGNWRPAQVPQHYVAVRIEGAADNEPLIDTVKAVARSLEIVGGQVTIDGGCLTLGSAPPQAG